MRRVAMMAVVILIACSAPAVAPAPSASASATPRYSAYSVVDATTQPPGSILVTLSNYAFTPSTLSLPAGKVVLFLANPSTETHDFSLREPSRPSFVNVVAVTGRIDPGKSVLITIDSLPAGVYRATCTVEDHAARGMVADVTVK